MVYNINQPNRVFVDSNGTQYTVFFNNIKTINGKKLIKESTDKVIYIKDTLGIERKDMPQISSKDILDYVKWLQRNKIKVYYKNVKISDLNLTQKDINLDKVKNLINDNDAEIGKIICSNDYYILDGHHRVVAQQYQNPNKIIKVLVVDLDIYRLLDICKKFKNVEYKGINEMNLKENYERFFGKLNESSDDDYLEKKYESIMRLIEELNDVQRKIENANDYQTKIRYLRDVSDFALDIVDYCDDIFISSSL